MPSRRRIQPRSLRRTARRCKPATAATRRRESPICVLWFRPSRGSRSSTSTVRPPGRSRTRSVEQVLVSRGERLAEADHLKTIAVADKPDLHLAPARPVGRHLRKAREAGYLVVGSIDVLCPAAGSRKDSLPYRRRLEIGDLPGVREIANVEHPQASILKPTREHVRIVGSVGVAPFSVVDGTSAAGVRRIREERAATRGVVHFEPEFGDERRFRLVRDVDDLRIAIRRCAPIACGLETSSAGCAAGLVRADDVLATVLGEGEHLLHLPLVIPEERADNPDPRIGATVLDIAYIEDHQPVWTD